MSRSRCPQICRTAAIALIALVLAAAVAAQERVALVIGNGTYANVDSLVNPNNDSTDMAAALRQRDFHVIHRTDLDLAEINAAVDALLDASGSAEAVLFYYAGHAFQVQGRNFLAPVDFDPEGEGDILANTVALDDVLARLGSVDALRLVILDACRNNPLELEPGLALVDSGIGSDFWIAYATDPGAIAEDGTGRNSPFTGALLRHIHTPDQSLSDLMRTVSREVFYLSDYGQTPWYLSSLLSSDFVFNPGTTRLPHETLFFQAAAKSREPALLRRFMDTYPSSPQVADARELLSEAQEQQEALPRDDGDLLWQLYQRTRTRELAQAYVDVYPAGRHVGAALSEVTLLTARDNAADRCARLATDPRDGTALYPGVPPAVLALQANGAIAACREAVAKNPGHHGYQTLLARAQWYAGSRADAVESYTEAAEAGDLRAMVSLGRILETGAGVLRDTKAAMELYESAAAGGSSDAQLILAKHLMEGVIVPRNAHRAVELVQAAAEKGDPYGFYGMGVLSKDGLLGEPAEAPQYFLRAAYGGLVKGYWAAAMIYAAGYGVEHNPARAADLLLMAAASDNETLAQLADPNVVWTESIILEVKDRLVRAGLYTGASNEVRDAEFVAALRQWRRGGFNPDLLFN